ncbi:hypothetical protein ACFLRX_03035 [Acidobacteriota bacterium]
MSNEKEQKLHLNKKLEAIGWGFFLIMIGGLWLLPDETVPEGAWLIGVGVIMLGLNAARSVYGIKVSGFTVVLGILALSIGISDLFGVDLPVFPILLILWGLSVVLEPFLKKNRNN